MKKTLTSLLCLAALTASAQVTQSYTAQSAEGTYVEVTDGTVVEKSKFGDSFESGYYSADGQGLDIGFDFKYDNKLMNRFAIGSHGYIVLGKDNVTTTGMSNTSAIGSSDVDDVIGYCYRSLVAAIPETEISYKTTGSEGNHELVVQFKNLQYVVDGWSGTEVRDTVSFQIRLDEATGNISFVTYGFEPSAEAAENMNYNDGFRIGLRGQAEDVTLKVNAFDGTEVTHNTIPGFISWRSTSFPADGLTLTFVAPAACVTPTTQPTNLQYTATSLAVSGSFTATNDADHYLTLLSESATLDVLPSDTTTYAKGDSIGSARVLAYSTGNTFESGDILSPAHTFYIYVLGANSNGFFGPKYNTSEPLTTSFMTAPAAPASMTLTATDSTKLVLSTTANEAGDDILVAYTTEPKMNDYNQILTGGAFGDPSGSYAVGDEITGGGHVVYAGKASDAITIEGLESGKVYHVTAWSRNAEGVYSSTTAKLDASTAITLPWTADFSKNADYSEPEGWTCQGSWGIDQERIAGRIESKDGMNGIIEWVETPDVYLPEGTNRIVMDLLMTQYASYTTSAYTLNRKDTIYVQVTEDGEHYTTIATYNKKNPVKFVNTNTPTKLYIPFTAAAGKKARIRFYFHIFESPTTYISGLRFEQKTDCDYPINVIVPDSSIVGGQAMVAWTPQTEETQWDVRYKKSADESWGEYATVENTTYIMTGLEGMTSYDVQVRARASEAKVSEWSDIVSFTSGLAVPFTLNFREIEELSTTWESKQGVLATPTVLTNGGSWEFYYSYYSGGGNLNYSNYQDTADDWFITPQLDLGDGSKTWYDASFALANKYTPSGADATLQLVIARDGETFNESDVLLTIKADEMPEAYGDAQTYKVSLTNITGKVRLGLYVHATSGCSTFNIESLSIQPNDDPTGIQTVDTDSTIGQKTYYTLDGKRLNAPVRGINIVRMADGTTQKVVVK